MANKGDVVFYKVDPSDLVEDVVALFTSPRNHIIHCAVIVDNDTTIEANLNRVVGYSSIQDYAKNPHVIKSYKGITDAQRGGIIDYCLKHFGEQYSVAEDIKIGVEDLTGIALPYDKGNKDVCSTLVWDAYKSVGIQLYHSPDASPEDIFECPEWVEDN